jgi:hypothetical protein
MLSQPVRPSDVHICLRLREDKQHLAGATAGEPTRGTPCGDSIDGSIESVGGAGGPRPVIFSQCSRNYPSTGRESNSARPGVQSGGRDPPTLPAGALGVGRPIHPQSRSTYVGLHQITGTDNFRTFDVTNDSCGVVPLNIAAATREGRPARHSLASPAALITDQGIGTTKLIHPIMAALAFGPSNP